MVEFELADVKQDQNQASPGGSARSDKELDARNDQANGDRRFGQLLNPDSRRAEQQKNAEAPLTDEFFPDAEKIVEEQRPGASVAAASVAPQIDQAEVAASDVSIVVDENDDSDLIYDKELKILLEDHKEIAKVMMFVSILLFGGQMVFGGWCIIQLGELGTWEDSLLINWFHILKICLNAYICQTFFKRIKANQPSSPLGYLSSYLTLFLYLGILFVFTDKLPENIPVWHLNILTIYAGSDIVLMFFAWIIQRNLVARRDELFRFKAGDITQEKKERDLFDIRYMPEEYMSDVEDTSDEEEEDIPAAQVPPSEEQPPAA